MSHRLPFYIRYLHYLRRSSKHIQSIHAFFFAGSITLLLALGILYFEYDFWRTTTYTKADLEDISRLEIKKSIEEKSESPITSFSLFVEEIGEKIHIVRGGGGALFEAKESYSKKEEFLQSSSSTP